MEVHCLQLQNCSPNTSHAFASFYPSAQLEQIDNWRQPDHFCHREEKWLLFIRERKKKKQLASSYCIQEIKIFSHSPTSQWLLTQSEDWEKSRRGFCPADPQKARPSKLWRGWWTATKRRLLRIIAPRSGKRLVNQGYVSSGCALWPPAVLDPQWYWQMLGR